MGAADPFPSGRISLSADSGFWVISGQHISRAVKYVAEWKRNHSEPVTQPYEFVTATVLHRETVHSIWGD